MTRVSIPNWNAKGVLPPTNPTNPVSFDRSPYLVSLPDVVQRFATSSQRGRILDGLLRFREDLSAAGLQVGFQWLNGSFTEDIEALENRPPGDIDVVTFYRLPSGTTQSGLLSSHPQLFDPHQAKATYLVDAYFVELTATMPDLLIGQSIYWYGVWSHRRNDVWKGYLQIDLDPADNLQARSHLTTLFPAGGTP